MELEFTVIGSLYCVDTALESDFCSGVTDQKTQVHRTEQDAHYRDWVSQHGGRASLGSTVPLLGEESTPAPLLY